MNVHIDDVIMLKWEYDRMFRVIHVRYDGIVTCKDINENTSEFFAYPYEIINNLTKILNALEQI